MKNFTQKYIKSFDGKPLCVYTSNINTSNSDKTIIVLHGMADHIERYEEFLNKLIDNNFKVIAYNQRGHYLTDTAENYGILGNFTHPSNPKLSCNDGFMNLIYDLDFLVNLVKTENSEQIFLFGHSMGSFVVTRYLQMFPDKIKAAVLCGTGKNPQIKVIMGNLIAKTICLFKGENYRSKLIDKLSFGTYNNKFKPTRTDFDWLNTVDNEVDKYINDPWCGGIFPAGFFRDFTKLMYKINLNNRFTNRFTSIFLISGDNDPVGNMGKSVKKLYNRLSKNNKKKNKNYTKNINNNVTLSLIKNARHEILLEEKKEVIHNQIINWLNKQ